MSKVLAPLPAGSQIRIVEADEDRLVLYIPGGGKSASGLVFFSLVWNGFVLLFTGVAMGGALRANGNDGAPLFGLVAFLGLFWTVGLLLGWFALKLKFERTFLLVGLLPFVVGLFMLRGRTTVRLTPAVLVCRRTRLEDMGHVLGDG